MRRYAVAWSLREYGTLAEALAELEFVQADPIRAPARAQDLILRHRVAGYRAGDLDRSYPDLDIDEDVLYAYGFVARRLRPLLYPRIDRNSPDGRYAPDGLAADVLAFVRNRGVTHPRDLQEHFGRDRVRNDWGGQSVATTRILERLWYYGLLRVARREGGVRLYEPAPPLGDPLDGAHRLRGLVLRIGSILAPLPEASLRFAIRPLRYAAPGLDGRRGIVAELLAAGELEAGVVDGVNYVWPAALAAVDVVDAEPAARVRFLAPFDPVVWDRERFELLWGWAYRFEAYTPAAKRQLGYYAMPLLWRDRVIGWANCAGGDVDVGFVDRRPRERRFSTALDDEIARLTEFLTGRS